MNNLCLQWHIDTKTGIRNTDKSTLHIKINGTSLTSIVHNLENANNYAHFDNTYLSADNVRYHSASGWRKSCEPGKSHIILLGCSCGDVDCSQLYVDTFCQDGWVHWRFDDWSTRNFSAMPTFWFEQNTYRQQVDAALEHLNR